MRSAIVVAAALLAGLAACGSSGGPAPFPVERVPWPPYEPGSLPPLREPGAKSPRLASYALDVSYDAAEHRISGRARLEWKHAGTRPVTSLPLHLYMNAFKNENTVFMRESRGHHRQARQAEDSWGWIEVSSIKLGDAELRPAATYGEDETTLQVPLPAPVEPGATVVLELQFVTQLPEVFARTGFKRDFVMIGQWFPKIGVLQDDVWHCDTFHLNSEFFADFGVYDVKLDVPLDLVVAATGVLTARTSENGRQQLVYRAEDVHDFAWMVDPKMQIARTTTDAGVQVLVYHRPEQARWAPRHAEAAKRTIETFSRLFYPYPWSVMTIIDPPPWADGGAGGMEYPTLVTTAADRWLTPPGMHLPEFVTVHEVGHNWFQGLLASNEVDEAFLDEGLNEYADGIVMEEWFGVEAAIIDWGGLRLGASGMERLRSSFDEDMAPITTRSYEFPSFDAYGGATYSKTAVSLKTLENMVGRERFFAAMGAYGRAWAFKHPRREDFFASLNGALGEDVSWFLRPAFQGTSPVDLRVLDLEVRKRHAARGVFGEGETRKLVGRKEAPDEKDWVSEILVGNLGQTPVIVDVALRFEDGTRRTERWDGREGRWKRLVIEAPSPVVEVVIDPDGHILLEDEKLENSLRTDDETGPSWRAGARVGFWEQTLLDVVGL